MQSSVTSATAANAPACRALQPEQAQAFVDDPTALFIDVRDDAAWQRGHVPGALHAPAERLAAFADPSSGQFRPDFGTARRFIVYCETAAHSEQAARTLQSLGYRGVAHVEGGFEAWRNSGLPVEAEAGRPSAWRA